MLPAVNLYAVPEIAQQGAADAASADQKLIEFARAHHGVAIFDLPPSVQTVGEAVSFMNGYPDLQSPWAAVYFPRIRVQSASGASQTIGVAGSAAGIYARLDQVQNVWKAPAGLIASILNSIGVAQELTDQESALLTQASINPVRIFSGGPVLWGARNASHAAGDAKYISSTRFAEMAETSLSAGLAWTAFEPDTAATWEKVRLEAEEFFQGLYKQGAFQGATPDQAYFVKCDATTTTAADVSHGQIKLVYGFALSAPSEFSTREQVLKAE